MNDGISRDLCSFTYISVAEIVLVVLSLGQGALLAKSGIKHAYWQIPVHPDDRWLLGMRWNGQMFCDATLPFGLRSAMIIFSAVADAPEWIVKSRGASHVFHYVDDFVILAPPNSDKCSRDLGLLMQAWAHLGVLVVDDKTEGPSTCLTILGIEVDFLVMELRLLQEKLSRLIDALTEWRSKRSGKLKDLESLVGLLQHVSQVVCPSSVFLRRLYNLLVQTGSFKPHFSVRLNGEAQADIEWWSTFLSKWNGTSILRPLRATNPDIEVWSDASGGSGCSAVWLQVQWGSLLIMSSSIAAKELFPILVAVAICYSIHLHSRLPLFSPTSSCGATTVGPGRSVSGIPVATPPPLRGVIIIPSLLSCVSRGVLAPLQWQSAMRTIIAVYLFSRAGRPGVLAREVPVYASATQAGKVYPYHR